MWVPVPLLPTSFFLLPLCFCSSEGDWGVGAPLHNAVVRSGADSKCDVLDKLGRALQTDRGCGHESMFRVTYLTDGPGPADCGEQMSKDLQSCPMGRRFCAMSCFTPMGARGGHKVGACEEG